MNAASTGDELLSYQVGGIHGEDIRHRARASAQVLKRV
jgi:hypothetical protein